MAHGIDRRVLFGPQRPHGSIRRVRASTWSSARTDVPFDAPDTRETGSDGERLPAGLEQLKQLLRRPALAEHAAERIALLQLRSQVGVFRRQPPLLHPLLQDVHQLVELERLGDEVRRTALHRIDRVLHGAVAGDDDDDDAGVAFAGRLDHVCAIDAGHPEVGDHDIEGELVEELDRSFATLRLDDIEPALRQALGHQGPQRGLVVREEQVKRVGRWQVNILTQLPEPPIAN